MPETAINIGYACNVLTDAMDALFVITGNTAGEVREELRCVLKDRESGKGQGRETVLPFLFRSTSLGLNHVPHQGLILATRHCLRASNISQVFSGKNLKSCMLCFKMFLDKNLEDIK